MKHPTKLLFVFVALFLPTALFAQSGPEIYAEANKINAEADKELNAAYDQLIKSIRADNEKDRAELLVARLQESQRAWLKYRDAQVAFVGIHANIGSASSRDPWHGQLQCRAYEGTHQRPNHCTKSVLNSPQRLTPYFLQQVAEATSQEFEIPVTPKLAAKIEKDLLEKNQHLT